jgi:hypothetical protein
MIQRIQTLWLFISISLSGFLVKGGIVNFIGRDGQKYFAGFSGISKITETGTEIIRSSIPLAAIILCIPVLSVVTILFYKSRKIQRVFAYIIITCSVCLTILVLYYSYIVVHTYEGHIVPGIKMGFPILIIISAIFAVKGISKDEALVKSYDRLR